MGKAEFCHLHVHSHYSLLDGANRIDDLVRSAAEDGQTALALTDHGNMFGAIELYKKARAGGVKPIIGCEIYLAKETHLKKHHREANPYYHLTLLARDIEGYRNLVQIASEGYLNGFSMRPRVDKAFIERHSGGLIALSGCISGEINRLFLQDQDDLAMEAAAQYRDIFGPEGFFLEIQRNGLEIQNTANEKLLELHKHTGIPLVATNDIHYLRHEDCAAHDVLLCIQTNAKVNDESRFRMESETLWFHTAEQMRHIFRDVPEAVKNTLLVSEQVDLELELGKYRVPVFESATGEDSDTLFKRLTDEGFAKLYPRATSRERERLEYERGVIREMGFVDYFLITWDFIRHAREIGVPVGPGRGSAAGSIVAYALGITKIDPIAYDLLFERFLNSSRISMPDIDIDFCRDGRERIIQYVRDKYGEECVAQIITFNTMASRLAVRDVGRAMDIPLHEVDVIAKKVPEGPGASLREALLEDLELQELRSSDETHRVLLDTAATLEGLARHAGVHAAGVVIGDCPLKELVPLYRNKEDITTQYPMNALEDVGLLKMDFLGLKTLTILETCVKLIERHRGEKIDLDSLSFDDGPTYELLTQGATLGVFQLESEGMRKLLSQLKPDCFEDIIAVLALYRPGPLGSGMVETFVECKHGRQEIEYLHPALEEVLEETYGVIVYQEQVMRITNVLAGFSLNEADSLRKAMGKKKPEIMARFRQSFIDGAGERDVPRRTAEAIWKLMEFFGGYGFNKSHTTAYAVLTFQTAYLKAHYLHEFTAANMTCESADTAKVKDFLDDAAGRQIATLPPCVNRSGHDFGIEGDGIRYSLEAVKGLGPKPVEEIVTARERIGGSFSGLTQLCEECDVTALNKLALEALVKSGALDFTGWDRGVLFAEIEDALALGAQRQRDRRAGQGNLFDVLSGETGASADPGQQSELAPTYPQAIWSTRERLLHEREAMGFYLSGHPVERITDLASCLRSCAIADVRSDDTSEICLVGLVTNLTVRTISRGRFTGQKMARFQLEDPDAHIGIVVFSELYNQIKESVHDDLIVAVRGKVSRRSQEGTSPAEIIAERIDLLDAALATYDGYVAVRLRREDEGALDGLRAIVTEHRGRQPLLFELEPTPPQSRRWIQAGAVYRVAMSDTLASEINGLLGERRVRLLGRT